MLKVGNVLAFVLPNTLTCLQSCCAMVCTQSAQSCKFCVDNFQSNTRTATSTHISVQTDKITRMQTIPTLKHSKHTHAHKYTQIHTNK